MIVEPDPVIKHHVILPVKHLAGSWDWACPVQTSVQRSMTGPELCPLISTLYMLDVHCLLQHVTLHHR